MYGTKPQALAFRLAALFRCRAPGQSCPKTSRLPQECCGAPVGRRMAAMGEFHKNTSKEPFLWNCARPLREEAAKRFFRRQYIDAKRSYDLISCCQAFCAYTSARGQETAMTAEVERKIGQDLRALRERAGLTQGGRRPSACKCSAAASSQRRGQAGGGAAPPPPDEVILPREIPGADEGETFRSGPGKAGLRRWRSPAFLFMRWR